MSDKWARLPVESVVALAVADARAASARIAMAVIETWGNCYDDMAEEVSAMIIAGADAGGKPMSDHRIGVLICGPLCFGLAVLIVVLGPLQEANALRAICLAAVGGWIVGRWK